MEYLASIHYCLGSAASREKQATADQPTDSLKAEGMLDLASVDSCRIWPVWVPVGPRVAHREDTVRLLCSIPQLTSLETGSRVLQASFELAIELRMTLSF